MSPASRHIRGFGVDFFLKRLAVKLRVSIVYAKNQESVVS